MSYNNKRQAATSGMSQTRFNQEAAGGSLNSASQPAPRLRSPNSRILDELLALGTTSGGGNELGQRASNSSSIDNQSNITIIDYRQGAPITSVGPFGLNLGDGFAPMAGPSNEKSQRSRSINKFDQFASQFKSSLGLGDQRRSRTGNSNNEPVQTFDLQQTMPAQVPLQQATAGNVVKILDIRRTKTNRRRPKQNCANRLSRDYENVMLCQLARDDEYDDDDDDYDEQDDDKNRVDQAQDRPAMINQSDHLQDQMDTTTRSKNQPKQQQQQQRQQSGETLSSFESDYDLLVYLGETETEDLVETERSLDYLDQTWRQSICGGASLAPTIDESLSELLQTPQNRFGGSSPRTPLVENNDDFDQLWTQTNTAGSRARGYQQRDGASSTLNFRSGSNNRLTPGQQQQNRGDQSNLLADLSYGTINQTRCSTSLPRSQIRHNSSGQLPASKSFAQTQVKSPKGRETRGLEDHGLADAPELVIQLDKRPTNQQGQSLAENIGNKLVSLFKPNQARHQQQHQTDQSIGPEQRSAAGGLTKQEAETVRQLNEFLEQARLGSSPMEAPQKPRRHQGAAGGSNNRPRGQADEENADELDRLLAEMSQSLDLDSLARYDPYSRGARQQQAAALPVNRAGKTVAAQSRQSPSKTTSASSRQHAKGPPTKSMGRNEFILNEYDGASRMLEQMINDQLDEAQLVTGNSSGGDSTTGKSRSRVQQHSTDRGGLNNSTSGPTSDEDRGSSTSQARKISSTCSTTTETSVVPSANRGQRAQTRTIPIEVLGPRDVPPNEVKKRQVLNKITHQVSLDTPARGHAETHSEQNRRRPLNYSRSLDAAGEEQAVVLIKPTQVKIISTKPLTPPVSSKSSTSSMEAADEDDGREVPPPPPVVDYNDFNENEHELEHDKTNCNRQDFKVLNVPKKSQDENQLIQVEPNEFPSPTSSEDEQPNRPISSGRHKRVMNQMKRRTMSGVRSVRQHLGRRFQGATSTGASIEPTETTTTTQTGRGHTNPLPPARSSSIGSSTKSDGGLRRDKTEELTVAAESPRQSRQRSRRTMATEAEKDKQVGQQQPTVELAGGKKSFGQQIRDRLSRSKSRLSNFLRPLSLHRPQQEVASDEEQEVKQPEVPLFQPSDIARNEPVRSVRESSLERQLRADLCEQIKPSDGPYLAFPRTGPKRSPSGRSNGSEKSLGSGDLSGLETVTANNRSERLFDGLLIRRSKSSKRKSRQTKRDADRSDDHGKQQQKRPSSLMSLKRFGESFGRNKSAASEKVNSAERVHDLDLEQQITDGAAAAVHQKRAARGNKRLRNRSTGDQRNSSTKQETAIKSVTPSRATTDDYFGFKAPIKTSPVAGSQAGGEPLKMKSLEVHQRVEMGPRVRPASVLVTLGDENGQTTTSQHKIFGRRRQRVAPNRSQSLKGADFTAARPASGNKTTLEPAASLDTGSKQSDSLNQMNGQSSSQKSVSFQNLAHDQSTNQRRPLSPVSPNTFRPVSASPGQELEENKSFSALMTETQRAEPGAITPIQLAPILSNHTQAAPTAPERTRSLQVQAQAAGSKHDRGSALLQDLRDKCTDLFGPNSGKRTSKETPTQVATTSVAESTPPSRPPRTRKRRNLAQSAQATRSKSLAAPATLSVIELQPASPPPASPFAAASESPDSHRHQDRPRRANTVKRLTSFAQQLRTSAADFFAAGPPPANQPPPQRQAASRIEAATSVAPSQQQASQSTSSTTIVQSRFRNLDEPLLQRDLAQWRPIIPIGGQKRDKTVRRSSSFRLAKDGDDQKQIVVNERSRTLAGGDQANLTKVARTDDDEHDDSYSDSTWDSSSDGDDDQDKAKRTANRNLQRRAHNRTKATRRRSGDSSSASETADGEGQQVAGTISSNRHAGLRLAAGAANEQMRAAAAASSSSNIGMNNKNNNDQDLNNNNRNSNQTIDGRNLRHLQHEGQDLAEEKTTEQIGGTNFYAGAPFGASVTKGPNENGSCKPLLGNNTSDCLPESRATDTNKQIAQISSVNERAFKFNENLPSPSQILSEIKRDSDESESGLKKALKGSEMTATRSARRGRVVSSDENQLDGSKKSQFPPEQAQEQNDQTNRLSIYENVNPQEQSKPQTAPREGASRIISQNLDGNQHSDKLSQGAKNNNETNRMDEAIGRSKTTLMTSVDKGKKPEPVTGPQRADANSTADDENSQQDDWSVEPVDQLEAAARISSNLKQQMITEIKTKKVAGAENGAVDSLGSKSAEPSTMKTTVRSELVRPANARQAERRLVPMTSIIHEPEDELMNLATRSSIKPNESSSAQNSPTTGDDQHRRQSNFSMQNGNSDNDDSESSMSIGCGRRRLESKLTRQHEQQQASSRPQGKLTSKPPVPLKPPNLPRATGPAAGGGGSLVRRLARNFDQAVQQHQQPVAGRTNVVAQSQQSAGVRPSPPRAQQLQELADEPKSDSTWYDAKSIEMLDEAEVAELLREFENEGQNQTNQQQLSDSDQYVTLSQDQPGRRDRAHDKLSGGGGEDNDDDATLNDDETLNDANEEDDDDGDLLDASQGQDEESVYASAAATNENDSRLQRASSDGAGGGNNDNQTRLDVGSSSDDEKMSRGLLVGGADRSPQSRCDAAAIVVVDVDEHLRGSGDAAATRRGRDGREACASRGGCSGGQLLEQRVAPSAQTAAICKLNDETTTTRQQRTNENADLKLMLTTSCVNQPGQSSSKSQPTTNATLLKQQAANDDDEAEQMKEVQSEVGQVGDQDDQLQDKQQLFTGRLFKVFDINETLVDESISSDKLQDGKSTKDVEVASQQDNEQSDDEDESSSAAAQNINSEQSSSCREDLISLSSSSLSSESMPELRQRKNLQRLYNIVNEICTSEEKFLATLSLLNEDFRRHILTSLVQSNSTSDCQDQPLTDSVLMQQPPFDCIGLVMKHLPQLQALNQNLYDELRQARNQWPSTQKISHVLVKIGPFLKHYSSYIRDFECIQQQFQENLKKSSQFRETIKQFERDQAEKCSHLSIQHHLLKPIQRIPQYRLLLQQYLHHLKPDDADYEDTVSALEVVSRVAEHANQSLSEGANFAKLLSLQAKIVGGKQRDIIQPGRLFLKEGELLKVCRKQIQPRWFVLLSDALFYLKQIQSNDILYLKYELPLDDCQVELPKGGQSSTCQLKSGTIEEEPTPDELVGERVAESSDCELNICTTVRSMTLIAKSRQERDDWFQALKSAIEGHAAKRRSFRPGQQQLDLLQEPFNGLIGRKAPIWTPDSRVNTCQLCTSNFSALFRRHHCRACGRVVCSACSSNKAPLIYLKCRAARVCDQCFESLRANMHLYYLPSCRIDERELRRLDEHFKTLLKSQFVKKRMFASSKAPKVVLLKGPNTTSSKSARDLTRAGGSKE